MNIIRAYPPGETNTSGPLRLISALRRFLRGVPPLRQETLPEPQLDLHIAPLAGEARLLVSGQPTGAWRKAVLDARHVTGSFSEAVNQAVVTIYNRAPASLTPNKPLPRGARPGGPRFGPRKAHLVPVAASPSGIQVASFGPRPPEWIETPAGMWAPQSGLSRPKRPTKNLYTLDDAPMRETEPISVKDYAAILSRLNHRPLDRSFVQ